MDDGNSNNEPTPVSIPDHELLKCIGRGSYGTVWLARSSMGMYRAVKIVFRESFQNQRPYERELSGMLKFEPLSRSHEGFVDVLHVGINEAAGYFYYVMELGDDEISGAAIDPEKYAPRTLGKEMALHLNFSFQDCLQLGLALSQALAELHKHGLVHRDVKPSNIIFVNGVPKLADIGLVAEASEARSYVGTEGFIPPEGPGAPQADVYSLGKVLYEISTGKDRNEFPALPTRLGEFPDQDRFLELNEVILHACANEVSQRYQSAWDLHAHLLVLANGKSVKRLRVLERRLTALKRIASVSVALAVMVAFVSYHFYREWRNSIGERQRRVGVDVANGTRAAESGDLLGAMPLFVDALRLDTENGESEITHRLRIGSVQAQSPGLTAVWRGGTGVKEVTLSPDGSKALLSSFNAQLKIFDVQTGALAAPPFGSVGVISAAYSPDGRLIVTAGENGMVRLWDAATLDLVGEMPHRKRVLSARFSPDGLHVVTAGADRMAIIWNVQTRQQEYSLPHADTVRSANFSHDGRLVVTASEDGTARIWDPARNQFKTLSGHRPGQWVTYAAFSQDDQRVITASSDHTARVWEVASAAMFSVSLEHGDLVSSADYSPDGRLILTACSDGSVRLWSADTLHPLPGTHVLRNTGHVMRAVFGPDGRTVVAASEEGEVRVWDFAKIALPHLLGSYLAHTAGGRFVAQVEGGIEIHDPSHLHQAGLRIALPGPVQKGVFSGNGAFLLAGFEQPGAQGFAVGIWSAANGKPLGTEFGIGGSFSNLSLSDDGKRAAVIRGNQVAVWDVVARSALAQPSFPGPEITAVVFSPDARRIAILAGNWLHVWDLERGREMFSPLEHPAPLTCAAFNPPGNLLATACADNQFTAFPAQIWNATTGARAGPALNAKDGITYVAFSSDGSRLVTASEDHTATVWDVPTGRPLSLEMRHDLTIQAADFNHNGRWIVTASDDRMVRIWDSETGIPVTLPAAHTSPLAAAAFAAGDERVVTFDRAAHAWEWKLPVDQRPLEELGALASLLSADAVNLPEETGHHQAGSPEAAWKTFKQKYPDQFTVSDPEILQWYDFKAEESRAAGKWLAAIFYLERLQARGSGDLTISARLERARGHLAEPH